MEREARLEMTDRNLTENNVKRGFLTLPSPLAKEIPPGPLIFQIEGREAKGRVDARGRLWSPAFKSLSPGTVKVWYDEARRLIISGPGPLGLEPEQEAEAKDEAEVEEVREEKEKEAEMEKEREEEKGKEEEKEEKPAPSEKPLEDESKTETEAKAKAKAGVEKEKEEEKENPSCLRMAKGSQIGFGEDYKGCPFAQQNECPKEIMEACRKAYWEAEIPVPQFSMTFESAIQARLLFSAVKALSEEASMELTPEGARIKVMDPSHVAMVDLWMPSFSFYEYGFSGEKPVRLPIAFEDLLKAFPKIDKETRLRIFPPAPVRKRKERDRIVLSFEGKLRKALEIELLNGEEISEERIPELNLKFQAEARLCVEDFLEVVRDAKKLASYLRIEATRDSLTLSAAGDSKKLRVPLTIADRLLSLEVSPEASEVKATYRLEYLEAALEALKPLTETVKVEFSKDYPIRIGEALPNGIEVAYAVAPVVE